MSSQQRYFHRAIHPNSFPFGRLLLHDGTENKKQEAALLLFSFT